ncbi:MAG: S-adenosylmethionine:tRNA ribosyltransferase-isomerase [Myxococcales bacterium]
MAYVETYAGAWPGTQPHLELRPAAGPSTARDVGRLVQVDPRRGTTIVPFRELPSALEAGDLLVVNDAATMPASLRGEHDGAELEVRLLARLDETRFQAVLFGAGDHRTRTELRALPPVVESGDRLRLGALTAEVVRVSPRFDRLVELRFDREGSALWAALYASARPVQYSHQSELLELWSVQTLYAAEPWAVEMPSAGRPLSFRVLRELRRRGVQLAAVTHAAGLSASGDPVLDRALPLPERYRIPAATVDKISEARRAGSRVLAVGTSVVRALEGSFRASGACLPGEGITSLRIGGEHSLALVDELLTGLHAPGESHFELLSAFVERPQLERALTLAAASGLRSHEFGDSMIVWRHELRH